MFGGAGAVSSDWNSRARVSQDGSGQVLGAGAAPTEERYVVTVLAWIKRHKRMISEVRTGVVTLRLILDHSGGVRDILLIRSSGSRPPDTTVVDQIRNSQPCPRPPPGTANLR